MKAMNKRASYAPFAIVLALAMCFSAMLANMSVVGHADNFTDIFYTNSFRGAFRWLSYFDWVGQVIQVVISVFSLFGVALLTIRIMTSMLYLSARSMWEEVHELKGQGGDMKDVGIFGTKDMFKTWTSGKSGTGVDAIVGAVLVLLPDVKKYSDFDEQHGQMKGEGTEEMTISQYILKISLPTVLTVFFFAMGFNGTLFQALAVSVDFLGNLADKAVSVNYTGYLEGLANSNLGYKFQFEDGTNLGTLKQGVAKKVFGILVSSLQSPDKATVYAIGQKVEAAVDNIGISTITGAGATRIAGDVMAGLKDGDDNFLQYISLDPTQVSDAMFKDTNGAFKIDGSKILSDAGVNTSTTGAVKPNILVFVSQKSSYNGSYFNVGSGT